jgi:DNA-binding transcriptional regulator YdaS (Cro superfamily)
VSETGPIKWGRRYNAAKPLARGPLVVSLIPSWCQELRAARLARDWSEDDLADQIQNWEYRHGAGRTLGVSRSYVSEWETGKRGVSRDYAIRIEGVTGIPRDHFIDRPPPVAAWCACRRPRSASSGQMTSTTLWRC